ncbi:MAG TPA: HEAT repeat domain-containing protein [Anaeromyxobacter sp.]|nr:HEAT repeat domain-containing protein [Anaeromyxobacter sp.]
MSRRLLPTLLAALAGLACGRGDLGSPDPATRARAVRRLAGARAPLAPLLVAQADASPLVRVAAAEAFAARGGAGAADALGKLLEDPAPEVAIAAATGLAAMPDEPRARQHLVAAYAGATPGGRAAIAEALEKLGVSLREAVEAEARTLWERNTAALERGTGAARAGAAEELGASARTEAVLRLVPLVDPSRNTDAALAAAAARGLGDSGDWSARPFLEALLASDDPFLVRAAADALGRLGDPAAADALAARATQEPGAAAAAAGEALAALPDAQEVGVALCELAVRSPDPAAAVRAAREARRREAGCPERPLLARLGRPGALAALAALAELGLAGPAAASAAERVAPLLDPARTPDAATRAAAARALGALGGAAAGPAVARRVEALAARIAERRARWMAPPAPARAPPEWIDAVSPDDAVELGAALAVAGRLRVDGAEALELRWVRDPLAAIRAGAVEGLAALGTGGALDAVAGALADPDGRVRVAAAEGLSRFGARGAAALARAAEAPDAAPEWRMALARALGETGALEAVPALARLLDGPSAPAAATALARLAAPGAAAPLAEYLARPEAPGRTDAIEALAALVARDGASAIAALLTDDRPEVRATAARALGRLGHEAASPRLEALRSDYYGRVRRAAVEALAKLPAGAPRAHR